MAEQLSTLDMDPGVIAKLQQANISTVQHLLAATDTPEKTSNLASRLGVPQHQVRSWADRANLMQIPEVGPASARLLQACGINSPSELQGWSEADLYSKLQAANAREHLLDPMPTQHVVSVWIRDAGILAGYNNQDHSAQTQSHA